jgi:hypothetical protein
MRGDANGCCGNRGSRSTRLESLARSSGRRGWLWRSTAISPLAQWRQHNGSADWDLVLVGSPRSSSDVSDDPRGVWLSHWPDARKTEAGVEAILLLGTREPCTAPLSGGQYLQPPSAAGCVCSSVLGGQTGSQQAWEMLMRCRPGGARPNLTSQYVKTGADARCNLRRCITPRLTPNSHVASRCSDDDGCPSQGGDR